MLTMAASSQLRFWTKQKDKHSKSSFKGRKTTTGTIRHSKNILNIVQPKCFIDGNQATLSKERWNRLQFSRFAIKKNLWGFAVKFTIRYPSQECELILQPVEFIVRWLPAHLPKFVSKSEHKQSDSRTAPSKTL